MELKKRRGTIVFLEWVTQMAEQEDPCFDEHHCLRNELNSLSILEILSVL